MCVLQLPCRTWIMNIVVVFTWFCRWKRSDCSDDVQCCVPSISHSEAWSLQCQLGPFRSPRWLQVPHDFTLIASPLSSSSVSVSERICRSTMWQQACCTRGTTWAALCRTGATQTSSPTSLWRSLTVRLSSVALSSLITHHTHAAQQWSPYSTSDDR